MRIAAFVCALSIALVFFVDSAAFEVRHTSGSGPGSLHQAILDANAAPNIMGWPDRITFNIPGTGPHIIVVPEDTLLAVITDPVVIDGYSQPGEPGAAANTNDWTTCTSDLGTDANILIQIDGTALSTSFALPDVIGLHVQADDCVIKGLAFTNFLRLTPIPGGTAIHLDGCDGTRIEGCFVGLSADGTISAVNLGGIRVDDAPNNIVGGTTAAARNLFGTAHYAVSLDGSGSTGNVIQGNLFGTDIHGLIPMWSSLGYPGVYAIHIYEATDNLIGGTSCEERNVIGNHETGVYSLRGDRNTISMNYIGVNLIGQLDPHADAIPNEEGIRLIDSDDNTIGGADAGNIVAHHSIDGVIIIGNSEGNTLSQNVITRNGQMGIDLMEDDVSTNDWRDFDDGPNQRQNFPVITSGVKFGSAATYTRVKGTMHSHPNTPFKIEVFSDWWCDASMHGEGDTYHGQTIVTTDATGNADFSVAVTGLSIGDVITSTATNLFSSDTSEFSECGEVEWGIPFEVERVIWLYRYGGLWVVKLPILNESALTAWSVNGTLIPGPWSGWLTVADSTSDYGDVVGGGKSMGKVYSLDVSQWPGGSFFALLRIDHENNQGMPMSTLVPVIFTMDDLPSATDGDSPPPASTVLRTYPNPAAFSTTLTFGMPRDGLVELDIFNARGQRVRSLLREPRGAGSHNVEWDGRDGTGRRVASGVYYVQLRFGGEIVSQKQVILR